MLVFRGAAVAALASLLFAAGVTEATPSVASETLSLSSTDLSPKLQSSQAQASLVQAVSGSDFDPGYIISDELFYRSGDMSQSEIQAFLNAKVGSCGNSNCLSIKRTTTSSRDADRTVCKQYVGATNELTSSIIYKVQEACGISAKVLLVTLQKEQGLITNNAPSDSRLARAMGYGCPDNNGGVCDAEYYGLYNQLYNAAWQFKRYSTPTPWGYYQPGVKSIQFHPNTSCGTKSVNIRNNATAALYNYTPYVPNAAALANLGGYGDACSSYGNRNFWDYYNAWFGSTNAAVGDSEIAAAYTAAGGASGALGTAGTAPKCGTASSCWQAFAHGVIHWTRAGGAYVVSGLEGDQYLALGGISSSLGVPTSIKTEFPNPDNGPGSAQIFSNGYLYRSASGIYAVLGAFNATYAQVGWIRGAYGWPTSDKVCTTGGCFQPFQNGKVYQAKSSSVVVTIDNVDIKSYFVAKGEHTGSLGYPSSIATEFSTDGNGTGTVQAFSSGYVYASAAGAFLVSGAFGSEYAARGWLRGDLGWPISERTCTGDECLQSFQGGLLFQTSASSAVHAVSDPAIAAYYAAAGGPGGVLGKPKTVATRFETANNGSGRVQAFEKGYVYASDSGVFTVSGGINTAYARAGWLRGALGWPSAESICSGGACTQSFQGGTIYLPSPTGTAFVVSNVKIADYYVASGGPSGALGSPQSVATDFTTGSNGDGAAQVFAGGYVYASSGGVFTVSGAINTAYARAGWLRGALGWPTGERVCTGESCSQQFQGGKIYQSTASSSAFALTNASIAGYYSAAGGPTSALGFPTSVATSFTTSNNGSGAAQAFQGGYVYSSAAGVYAVDARFGAEYNARGWLRGSLGWPTAESECDVTACVQLFQHGKISLPAP